MPRFEGVRYEAATGVTAQASATGSDKRLNGWKAIAAFFGRDRTTVARWAKERGLPVHYVPGGKQKSVFAIERELEAWRSQHAESGQLAQTNANIANVAGAIGGGWSLRNAASVGRGWLALAGLTIVALAFFYASPRSTSRTSPALMAKYIAARDVWARRTPEDVREAIRLYEKIIGEAPDFAPARAGLAEAWLIYREYGAVSDAQAFGIARIAAQKAVSLDPNLASAHRANGFIDYWWDNEPRAAVEAFKRALALDDNDAQTHFWFANILADLGAAKAAERQYTRARLLAPGSQAIAVEHACAQWQAGNDRLAQTMMTELKMRYPADATISNCLAWVYMGLGDIRGYAREYRAMARMRREPEAVRLSAELDAAIARDPKTAHRVLIDDASRQLATGTRRIREVPAFWASSMGDRAELLKLMQVAQVHGEHWYSPSITARIAARWQGDSEVQSLLAQLRVAPPQIDGI